MLTKNTRFFITAMCFAVSITFGINFFSQQLSSHFFPQTAAKNPHPYLASLSNEEFQELLKTQKGIPPEKKPGEPIIQARAAYSLFLNAQNQETKILFSQKETSPLPIASLTKLMTAVIVLEEYSLNTPVVITPEAVSTAETFGDLKAGEVFTVRDLLYPLLMESSNDAAVALADVVGRENFIRRMNEKAQELGMVHTSFVNPHGLDPVSPVAPPNLSTAKDLSILAQYIIQNDPAVFDILSQGKFTLYTPTGEFHHRLFNTNKLLQNGWPGKVLGGKTGWTQRADGCLIMILESPNKDGYIVTIILGSNDRFGETEELVDWVFETYE